MKRHHATTLIFLLCGTLGMSGCKDRNAGRVLHPLAQYMVGGPSAATAIVLPQDGKDVVAAFPAFVWHKSEMRYGVAETPAEQVFGVVQAALADEHRNVYVMDQKAAEVRVFDSLGNRVETLGRAGRGPGELVDPQSMVLDDAHQTLLVGDLTRQLHVFRRSGNKWEYQKRFSVPVAVSEMCQMGGRTYVHGVNAEIKNLIHEVGDTGQVIRSFGQVYTSDASMVQYTLSKGHIACVEATNTILFVSTTGINRVYAYDPDGNQKWVMEIANFRPVLIYELPNGFSVARRPGGWHAVKRLVAGPEGLALIQIALLTPESAEQALPFVELRSFVINTRDQSVEHVSDSLPYIHEWRSTLTIGNTEEPFPQVIVRY